ncbi:MAG TPA: LURP-one-related family protein [Acidimicrobiia bacterium]|nr:LURP-one-related family protein [Acidimicrobiia bacterium]
MGLLRDRREERRDEPGDSHYQLREKMFSIGDDYWVETGRGERAFKVDGKALRVRDTLVIESPSGDELCTIQEKKVRVRDTMDVERGGDTIASVKKAMVTPLRERYSIDVHGGNDLEAKGNIVDHEYTIERDGDKVAEVSKRWFRVRDTYGIEVEPGEDAALVIAVVVCIDRMGHD